jgi:plasmid stability protein
MRTTLNLDDDVAEELAARARRDGRSMSRVANELIRAGVRFARRPELVVAYDPPTFDTGQPLLDVTDVADALELVDRS